MTKANRKGRNDPTEHFAMLHRRTMETPAWRALSLGAKSLYPWLLLEWKGPKYNNNGRISLSVRQAAMQLGIGRDAAMHAFHDLQAKGFLEVRQAARLGSTGHGKSHEYELTEHPMPNREKIEGRKLYEKWTKDGDFDVVKAMANNPKGRNGKNQNPDTKTVMVRHGNRNALEKYVTKSRSGFPENRDD